MNIPLRNFGRWISLVAFGCSAGSVVVSCGSSSDTSIFDGGRRDAGDAWSFGGDDSSISPLDDSNQTLIGDGASGCPPKTCADLGFTCGPNSDGCGNVIDCGKCSSTEFCGGGGYSKCGTGLTDGGDEASTGDGSVCMPLTCAAVGFTCGKTGDGCGGVIDCGACPMGQYCGGGGFSKCGTGTADGGPPCTPATCASLNYNCGAAGDGCGGVLNCGSVACPAGQYCGGGGFNKCGNGTADGGPLCIPATCASLGFTCGAAGDGCGGSLSCGTCTSPTFCGGGGFNQCGGNNMLTPEGGLPCTPLTCMGLGINCGPAGDGCGGQLQCGTCAGGQICGGTTPGVCGTGMPPCTGLCQQQVKCDGGLQTTISGMVFAGMSAFTGLAPDPVPNVLVYVPNAPLAAFTPGASCRQCGADVSGSPLVSTYTDFDGTFTLTNVPVGTTIPVVIQLGRWRRVYNFNVPACATTSIGALNLPRNQSEGNIPLTAISTGNSDSLECVLLKMGIDQAEFTPDSAVGGTGRIQVYVGAGPNPPPLNGGAPGATMANTRTEPALMETGGTYMNYDQIMLPCWGGPATKTATELADLVTYSDSGGHFFATHFSYSWLVGNAEFNTVAQWGTFFNPQAVTWTLNVSTVVPPSPPTPHVESFAKWLNLVRALSNFAATVPPNPQVAIFAPRHDANAVANGSVDWIDGTDPVKNSAMVEHFTFNTPVGAASQCGHDIFSDFHVADSASNGTPFPNECNANKNVFTAQEKILEFMIWDLASCVPPPPPPQCTPITCGAQNISCGPAGNGCGGSIDCGPCPPGQQCGGGGVYGKCVPIPDASSSCVPRTCMQQVVMCGPAGNGCGASLDCGPCTPPQTCGGGGVPGHCGGTTCTPLTCAQQNISCGPAGDGCGASLNCGPCPPGQTCGGGGVPGQCGGTTCMPVSCAAQNIACGPASDGCGNLQQCGPCPPGQTCGGGGVPGQCGGSICKPFTCAQLNISCGPAGDGCGNLLDCGGCPPPQTCGGGGISGQCGGVAR
jgi:hypothetical protein